MDVINEYPMPQLLKLEADGLIELTAQGVSVTVTGRNFIRNICSAFDLYLPANRVNAGKTMFSNAV